MQITTIIVSINIISAPTPLPSVVERWWQAGLDPPGWPHRGLWNTSSPSVSPSGFQMCINNFSISDFIIIRNGKIQDLWYIRHIDPPKLTKLNQAEVWPRLQCLLKLLLSTKGVEWVKVLNSLDLLCLWQWFCILSSHTRCSIPWCTDSHFDWYTIRNIIVFIKTDVKGLNGIVTFGFLVWGLNHNSCWRFC